MSENYEYVVFTDKLTFQYPDESRLGLNDIDIKLKKGDKFLLIGPNGAGKSTLLKVLAGKKLIKGGKVELFGINPFDLQNNYKINNKNIVYLGTEWANNEITKRDIKVNELVKSVGGDFFIERRDELIDLLEINCNWRMNRCSDGERRRVQLCMGLLKPFDLLLLDEVTIDLDVLVRQKLLEFLFKETKLRGCCIIYATHIFDGLGEWADTVIHLKDGKIEEEYERDNIIFSDEKIKDGVAKNGIQMIVNKVSSLYPLALSWLKRDRNTVIQ
jgi:CCR4-NOT complex subunit CAF16